jgi:coatomer subunit beta'
LDIDLKQLALEISTDPDHRFDLALSLDALDVALSIAEQTPAPENEIKWKAVGDRALSSWKFATAKRAYEQAGDVGALFLLGLATGDTAAMKDVGRLAKGKGLNNIAFAASWQTGDARGAVDLLVDTERASEAALFARTYAPSRVGKAVNAWRGELETKGRARVGALIADPLRGEEHGLFEEGWEQALHREEEVVGRETNGVHIDTGVDLRAI